MDSSRRRFLAAFPAAGLFSRLDAARQPAASATDPLGVRADFPAAEESLYLDAAYIAPTPRPVVDAGRAFAESKGRQPISLGDMLARTDQVRALLDRIAPDRMGALHVERTLPEHRYEIYKTAKKFDYATLAFGPVYQLGAALDYLDTVGVARIEQHTVGLAQTLADGLRTRGLAVLTPPGNRSSIVAFANPADPGVTRAVLDGARARVSVRENGRQIRVSPALFNTTDDIRRFLDVAEQLRAGRP